MGGSTIPALVSGSLIFPLPYLCGLVYRCTSTGARMFARAPGARVFGVGCPVHGCLVNATGVLAY